MTWYLVRRIGQSIAVVIGVLILTFILVHLAPGVIVLVVTILAFRFTGDALNDIGAARAAVR